MIYLRNLILRDVQCGRKVALNKPGNGNGVVCPSDRITGKFLLDKLLEHLLRCVALHVRHERLHVAYHIDHWYTIKLDVPVNGQKYDIR